MNTPLNSDAGSGCQTRLVRLGRDFTQVHMEEKSRRDAVESAFWRTCSPHEWTWTPEQQANMAMYCLWAAQRLEMLSELASGKQVIHEPNSTEQQPQTMMSDKSCANCGSYGGNSGCAVCNPLAAVLSSQPQKHMQPHQQRVVAEKAELDEKLARLSEFIETSPIFAGLPDDERGRLVIQKWCMGDYSDILGKRIAAF